MAAAYLGISERAFEMRWRREQLPEPIRIGRRLLWDRAMLDKWVDEISGLAPRQIFLVISSRRINLTQEQQPQPD